MPRWSKQICAEIAQEFDTRTDFAKTEPNAYRAAGRNGWLDDICEHMKAVTYRKWDTEQAVMESAAQYTNRTEWARAVSGAVRAAVDMGIYHEATAHMESAAGRKPWGYWNLERCIAAAQEFNSRLEFAKGASTAYQTALRNDWLDECCQHMDIKTDALAVPRKKRAAK